MTSKHVELPSSHLKLSPDPSDRRKSIEAENDVIIFQSAVPRDIPSIVKLQTQNLIHKNTALPLEESLSWETNSIDLKSLDSQNTILAKNCGNIVGYLLAFNLEVAGELSKEKGLVPRLGNIVFEGRQLADFNICIGQILVEKQFRGRSIAPKLYEQFIERAADDYDIRLAGVRNANLTSWNFHTQKLGMQKIGAYGQGDDHSILMLDLRKF